MQALHNRVYRQRRYRRLSIAERNGIVLHLLAGLGIRPEHEVDFPDHVRTSDAVAIAIYAALPPSQQEALETIGDTILATSFTLEEVEAAEEEDELPGLPPPPPEPSVEDFGIPPVEEPAPGPNVDTAGLEQ